MNMKLTQRIIQYLNSSQDEKENFNTIDTNNDGLSNIYNPLIQNTIGNFNISTVLIKTKNNFTHCHCL